MDKREFVFNVCGMNCSSCVSGVEKAISSIAFVSSVRVNLVNGKALVAFDNIPDKHSFALIIKAINDAGYSASYDFGDRRLISKDRKANSIDFIGYKLVWSIVLSVFIFIFSSFAYNQWFSFWYMQRFNNEIMFLLAFPIQFIIGWRFIRNAFFELSRFTASMDSLVAIGTLSAFFYSSFITFGLISGDADFRTSAMVITVILLGHYLESRARYNTNSVVNSLLELTPSTAFVIRQGQEIKVEIRDLMLGDVFIVRPGERIAIDGVIVEGESFVDQSMITGEPKPIFVDLGASVIGGTINRDGFLKVRVTKDVGDTVLSQMIDLIEKAQASKADIQRIADRIAGIFVPIVLSIAIITFFSWFFYLSSGFDGDRFVYALMNTVAVLVVACPCAMGLATPTAIVVAIGEAAGFGVIIKRGDILESLYSTSCIVFDKTGTLTTGNLKLVDLKILDENLDKQFVMELIASAEKPSSHPIARAILDEFSDGNVRLRSPKYFKNFNGEGIEAHFGDDVVFIGTENFIKRKINITVSEEYFHDEFITFSYVSFNGRLIACFAVGDSIRDSAYSAIDNIRKLGLDTVILSGDNAIVTGDVARKLAVANNFSRLLPEDKIIHVRRLQENGKKVLMIGDGINDAPALSQSDTSIAIASGTDIAIDAADVIFLKNDLSLITKLINLGKATIRTIRYNLFWTFFYNSMAIPLAAFGVLTPVMAASITVLSSLFVVGNSMRLKNKAF